MAGVQRSRGLSGACVLLVVISGMERFAFKGVASNLVMYLTDVVKMSNAAAAKTVNNWIGLTYIMPLLVAPLAESLWSRFSTILASSFFYVLGLMAVTYSAFVHNKEAKSFSFFFLSLCVISLGQGGYNPSLQTFAADQLCHDDDDDHLPSCNNSDDLDSVRSDERSWFFTMWYTGICVGSLLGYCILAYIQDTFGWGIGFAIPSCVMALSVLLFSAGTRLYSIKQTHDHDEKPNPWTQVLRSIKSAVRRVTKGGNASTLESKDDPTMEYELQKRSLCDLEFVDTKELQKNSDGRLRNVKVVLKLLPIWTMLLIFAVIFQQPATFFTKQGMTMERGFGSKVKIPAAALQSAITVSVIALMPLYNRLLIPLAKKITRSEKGISVMQRMGAGMILSTIAMVIAALVEERRLRMSRGSESLESVPMSIFWLLPQYILLGIADIFTVVGMQEFFYGEVPVKMRTMGIALYTSVFGAGSFMSSVLISLVQVFTGSHRGSKAGGWFSDDMREARIDKYYWLLAVLSALSFMIYTILCRCYRSSKE